MRKAFFQLHVAILLAGITGVLGRLISINEASLVWLRLLITAAALWLMLLWKPSGRKIPVSQVSRMLGVGAIVGLHWVTFYGSVKYANVSVALVSFSTLGFFSALLEPLLLRKKTDIGELMLGLLAVLGVAFIFHFDTQYEKGILFGLVAALLAALFTVLNKKILEKNQPAEVTRWEMTGGLMAVSVLMPFYFSSFDLSWQIPTPSDWIWLIILALFCTVWAFNLSLRALEKISPFTVNLSYNLEPVYGILLAFLLFDENRELNLSFYVGLSFIVSAILLQMNKIRRKPGHTPA